MIRWFRRHRCPVPAAVVLALALAACAPPPPPPAALPDGPTRAKLLAEARQALVALGSGRFEVLTLEGLGEPRGIDMVDPLEFHSHYAVLDFAARIRVTAPLHVARSDEQAEQLSRPGWNVDRAFGDLQLGALERDGDYLAGTERLWHGAAMCLDLEPGWRFDQFDSSDRHAVVMAP